MAEHEMTTVEIVIAKQSRLAGRKDFSTGSRGFHLSDKLTLENGRRYQCNVTLVEIGSKPAATVPAKSGRK